ncbi:MAG: PfkB family carbohydrate kinase [Tepidisphaeraceae bacterium]|jgi:sugar/nucleoside kinase (ribokinase family)
MALTRQQISESTAGKLSAALPTLGAIPALIGLDGFVDEIIAVVDKRLDRQHYEPMKTITVFGQRILKAAGQSSNYELDVKKTKLGGNGPIMANALAAAGLAVTYIGCLGYPTIHPVFAELARRAKVLSIAEPGHTDALEFEDGKLMLGKHQSLGDVNWENLVGRIGKEQLVKLFSGAKLIGMLNWTMLPFLSDIWKKLQSEILPECPKRERILFVDLCDPEKRTRRDISMAMEIVSGFQSTVNLVLGLNLKESEAIAQALGIALPADSEPLIERTAGEIRGRLGISCVVIHPRKGAAAATERESARFAGPFVQQPKISTGAGDHFNAGFCIGRVVGLSLEESLCAGVATSGYYVRNAESPTGGQLAEFIANLPLPQG